MKNTGLIVELGCMNSESAANRGNGERVAEGVGVLERECSAVDQWVAVVDEAVVKVEALEDAGVDEPRRAEPAAAEVDG